MQNNKHYEREYKKKKRKNTFVIIKLFVKTHSSH